MIKIMVTNRDPRQKGDNVMNATEKLPTGEP